MEDARRAFIEGEKSEQRLTEQHIRDAKVAFKQAQKYLSRDEKEAADRLFALANEHAKGKSAREILALLNNEKLLVDVQEIVSKVKSIKTSKEPCN